MASRTTEDVKHEIETEREALGDAVDTLRGQALRVRRKLPFVAAGIAALAVVAGLVRHRVSGITPRKRRACAISLHRD